MQAGSLPVVLDASVASGGSGAFSHSCEYIYFHLAWKLNNSRAFYFF